MMTASVTTWYDCTKRNFLEWMEAPFQAEHLLFKKRAPEKIRHNIGGLAASYLKQQADRINRKQIPPDEISDNVIVWERIDNRSAASDLQETAHLLQVSLMQNTPEEAKDCARIAAFFNNLQGPASARKLMCAGLMRAFLCKEVNKKHLDDLFDKPDMLSKLAGKTSALLNTYRAETLENAMESTPDLGYADWRLYERNALCPQAITNEYESTANKQILIACSAGASAFFTRPSALAFVIAGVTAMWAATDIKREKDEDKTVIQVSTKEWTQLGLRWASYEVCAIAALTLPLVAAWSSGMQGSYVDMGLSCAAALFTQTQVALDPPRRRPCLDSMGLT